MICISCKSDHNSDYCPYCGEKSGTRKITLRSISEDTLSTLTAMDRGVLFNVKSLLLRPQEFTTEYILGKRRGILNPISFLVISTTLYLIIESLLRVPIANPESKLIPESDIQKVGFAAGKQIAIYFKYFWILSIIPLATSTKLIFGRYNFIEHLAINSFILGQATFVGLISYLIVRIDLPVNPLVYLMICWLVYRVFVKPKEKYDTILMSVGALLLFVVQLFVIIMGIGLITS
jgi:hypothetical protein